MRIFLLSTVVFGLIIKTLPAWGDAAEKANAKLGSPPCEVRERAWTNYHTKHFQILTKNPEGKFNCEGAESVLAAGLIHLYDLKFTPNDSNFSPHFYQMFKDHTQTIDLQNPSMAGCKVELLALAEPGKKKIQICQMYYSASRETQVATLFHEGWHLHPDAARHVACSKGPFIQDPKKDTRSCDETFFGGYLKGSGFNADIFFLSWTLRSAKNNTLSVALLKSELLSILPDRFNKITAEETKAWRK